MITEKERKNREELFKLMQENPDLPVVAMVDGEIPGDDSGYWLGAWGSAGHIAISNIKIQGGTDNGRHQNQAQ